MFCLFVLNIDSFEHRQPLLQMPALARGYPVEREEYCSWAASNAHLPVDNSVEPKDLVWRNPDQEMKLLSFS